VFKAVLRETHAPRELVHPEYLICALGETICADEMPYSAAASVPTGRSPEPRARPGHVRESQAQRMRSEGFSLGRAQVRW
jgi:hypothetical protein